MTDEELEAQLRRTDLPRDERQRLKSLLFGRRYSMPVKWLTPPPTDFNLVYADIAEAERRLYAAMRVPLGEAGVATNPPKDD